MRSTFLSQADALNVVLLVQYSLHASFETASYVDMTTLNSHKILKKRKGNVFIP